jgi:hypothetical protein
MMTRRIAVLAALALPFLSSCKAARFLTGNCEAESIEVVWPVEIRRDGVASTTTLRSAVTLANVGSPAYELLRASLVDGTLSRDIAVIWNVPAFGGTGGIAMRHRAVLAPTGTAQIANASEFGGWGTADNPVANAFAHVRTTQAATVTSGTIRQLSSAPSRYQITIDATEASGSRLQISGEASFFKRVEKTSCY